MIPEQIDKSIVYLESLPGQIQQKTNTIDQDHNLSPAGRSQQRSDLRHRMQKEIDQLESQLASTLRTREKEIIAAIDNEKRRFFRSPATKPGKDQAEGDRQLHSALSILESNSRRGDTRSRWRLMSGEEMLKHYRQLLQDDDRTLIELYEFEAPRVLQSRGDNKTAAALLSAAKEAQQQRHSKRLKLLTFSQEKNNIRLLRLDNAAALLRKLLQTI